MHDDYGIYAALLHLPFPLLFFRNMKSRAGSNNCGHWKAINSEARDLIIKLKQSWTQMSKRAIDRLWSGFTWLWSVWKITDSEKVKQIIFFVIVSAKYLPGALLTYFANSLIAIMSVASKKMITGSLNRTEPGGEINDESISLIKLTLCTHTLQFYAMPHKTWNSNAKSRWKAWKITNLFINWIMWARRICRLLVVLADTTQFTSIEHFIARFNLIKPKAFSWAPKKEFNCGKLFPLSIELTIAHSIVRNVATWIEFNFSLPLIETRLRKLCCDIDTHFS